MGLWDTANSGDDGIAPLFERESELAAIRAVVAAAASGTGILVLVEGQAGIGKTSLLAEAATIAGDAGFHVRRARGGEMERDMAFGVARQLFEPLLQRASEEDKASWLAGSARHALFALGEAGPALPEGSVDAFAPINGLYWLVANLSGAGPVALIVDDVHWSDAPSLRFLTFLQRRLADIPVALVLGLRTGEPDEPEEVATLQLGARRILPTALSPTSVQKLIAAMSGREPSAAFAAACGAATGGNPFLVVETLRELRAEGLRVDDAAADSISDLAPDTVARSVLLRLGRFGAEAVALARAVAVLGRAPQLRHVAHLAGLDDVRAAAICDDLRKAEVLAAGLPIEFVHPLLRQAIYRDLPEGECSSAHRRAAEILASTSSKSTEVAVHLMACAGNGDQWVVARLLDAAQTAMREGAYDNAVAHLERALAEPPDDDVAVLYALGRALVTSDPPRAAEIFEKVVRRADDETVRTGAILFLVVAYQQMGDLPRVVRSCDAAIELVGDLDADLVLGVEAQRFFFRRWASQPLADAELERVEKLAADVVGATTGELLLRQAVACERFCSGAPMQEMVEMAFPFPELPWAVGNIQSSVPLWACKALFWSGRYEEARGPIDAWVEFAQRRGWLATASVGIAFLAELDRLAGRLVDAEAEARTSKHLLGSLPGSYANVMTVQMNLAAVLLVRGDIVSVRSLMQDADLAFGPEWGPITPWPLEVRGYLRAAEGDLEGAAEDLLELGAALERIAWLNPAYPPWRQEATETLARLGRDSEGADLIRVAEERARRVGVPHAIGTTLRARSFVEPRSRQLATLREAVSILERHGPPHELGRSLFELGAALRRTGSRSEAREPLRAAIELAHRCGAVPLEEKGREELIAAGGRPRRVAISGVESLTVAELRTARLAAEGFNNREIAERLFVTVRTVETHLTHVYDKLAIGGRPELAEALTGGSDR